MAGLPVSGGFLLQELYSRETPRPPSWEGWVGSWWRLLSGLLGRRPGLGGLFGERGNFVAACGLLDAGVKEGGGLADLEGVAGVSDPEPRSLQAGND